MPSHVIATHQSPRLRLRVPSMSSMRTAPSGSQVTWRRRRPVRDSRDAARQRIQRLVRTDLRTVASTASGTASPSPASTASTTAASATSAGSGPASTSTSTSTPSSSMSRTKVVAIAVGISVPFGIIAISLIACLVWCRRRRRHEQLRSEKRQQLESTAQAAGVGNSRPEFRWPARIAGTTQELPTQYHTHEMPAKEPMTSPSSSDYHISPLPVAPAPQKQPVYQVQSDKIPYQHEEFYQPPKKAQDKQEPQELPSGIEDRHELEGSPSPLSPTGRFSYQTYEK